MEYVGVARFFASQRNPVFSRSSLVYGHITLKTPVLVRSLKISNVESSQYLDG